MAGQNVEINQLVLQLIEVDRSDGRLACVDDGQVVSYRDVFHPLDLSETPVDGDPQQGVSRRLVEVNPRR